VKVGSQFGIGERLRSERIRRKRSINDISRETRIAPRMLEAIENDDFNSLPGLVFARNFVKQYALALGLDPEPILAELPNVDISTTPMPEPPEHSRPKRTSREIWDPEWNGAISSFAWFAVAVAAGVAAYIHFNRPLESVAGAKHPAPVAAVVQARAKTKPPEHLDAAPAGNSQAAPASATPAVPTEPGGSAGSQQSKPVETAEDNDSGRKVKVSITAHADSWIQVTADGRMVFTGTLKPNESREIFGNEMVKLVAGNAGGITVSLNGRTLDPLGAAGQVKVVRLTGEGLQAGVVNPRPMNDRL
jgi:cytoskeletal protein RodZ